jgi:DNA invertase Pin-like site-specific DNA recombinase
MLVVAELDRTTRSMMDGVHIIERIHARGAMIKVLDKHTWTSPHPSPAPAAFSSMARARLNSGSASA